MSSLNMLSEQSFGRSSLVGSDSVSTGHPPFTATPAFSGDFLGLPLQDDENLWGLGSMSPSLSTWNGKEQVFGSNSHVRNGQPTPPPQDDRKQSQDIYNSLAQYQLDGTPPMDLDPPPQHQFGSDGNSAGHNAKRRKVTKYRSPIESDGQRQERAKREKFLERNRLAASKCRQKKKEHTMLLESRYKEQADKKEELMAEIARLRSDLLGLKNEVLKHAQCGDEPIKLHLAQMVKKITYNDAGSEEVTDTGDAASPSSEAATTPVPQVPPSFGFDDRLQIEPQGPGALEGARRDSEASLMTEGSYGFADDGFDELINV